MGSYPDASNQRHEYASYGIVDSRLSWTAQKWSAYVEANNLLNKHYVDYGNVPQPGAWIVTGVNINL